MTLQLASKHKSRKSEDNSIRVKNTFIGGNAAIGKKATANSDSKRRTWQDNPITYIFVGILIILAASFIWNFINTSKGKTIDGKNETIDVIDTTILDPIWVNEDDSLLILNKQVKIEIDNVWSGLKSVDLIIRVSDENPIFLTVYKESKRKTFVYKNQEYFFDVLDINDDSAKISMSKKT